MTAQTVSSAVAKRDKADQLVTWLRRQQDDIAMAAASHVKPSAVIRVTQGALRRDPKLAAAAIANPQSLLYALLDCARLGHEPDTDDYYLVPFGSEVTGIEGYKGIIERMYRAGGVSSVVAQVVRKSDRYTPRGENTPPLHEYDDFASPDERGPMRGAYAYALFPGGECSQVIRMGRAEIMEHKKASRGSDRADSPWQQWEPAMWKKTVLRALEPYVPTSTEYRMANNLAPAMTGATHTETNFTYLPPPPENVPDGEIVDAEIVDDPAPAAETPKPRTRRAKPATPPPAADPGEPGSDRHRQLVGIVRAHFKRLGYTDADDQQRLEHTARLARVAEITSTSDLDEGELAAVADALSKCKDIDQLKALLEDGETSEDAA